MSLALDLQAFLPSFTGDLEKAFLSERHMRALAREIW
jgi:hypothetical protein